MGLVFFGAGGSFLIDARKWFTGPIINFSKDELEQAHLEKDRQDFQLNDDLENSPVTNKEEISSAIISKHKDKVEVSQVENAL